jgi:hypothetical protein
MSYLIFESVNAWIKNEMGYSNPSIFFCNKTIATVSKEANKKIRNSLE